MKIIEKLTGDMPVVDLGLMAAGAGLSGTLGGFVQQAVPTLDPKLAKLVAGVGINIAGSYINQPMLVRVGQGVLIDVIGDYIQGIVAGLAPAPAVTAAPVTAAPMTVESYIGATYGV